VCTCGLCYVNKRAYAQRSTCDRSVSSVCMALFATQRIYTRLLTRKMFRSGKAKLTTTTSTHLILGKMPRGCEKLGTQRIPPQLRFQGLRGCLMQLRISCLAFCLAFDVVAIVSTINVRRRSGSQTLGIVLDVAVEGLRPLQAWRCCRLRWLDRLRGDRRVAQPVHLRFCARACPVYAEEGFGDRVSLLHVHVCCVVAGLVCKFSGKRIALSTALASDCERA
jgi:hypothetical protein